MPSDFDIRCDAVGAGQDRHRQDRLLRDAVGLLDLAAEQQVELLVGAAELDVGLDRHGVVALEQRIEQLEHRDRLVGRVALGEVVALEQLGDGRACGRGRNRSSIAMSSHSLLRRTSVRLGVEHLEGLALEGLGVGVDLLAREHRAGSPSARRVAHARGVVADDQDDRVAEVLELAQLAQDDGVAEVDVGRRRVDAELDAQRPALGELASRAPSGSASTALRVRKRASSAAESVMGPMLDWRPPHRPSGLPTPHGAFRRRTDRPARRAGTRPPGPIAMQEPPTTAMPPRPSPSAAGDGPEPPSAKPKVKKLRLLLILTGLAALALVSTVFGMMMAVASDLPQLENKAEYERAENSIVYADGRGHERLARLTGNENRILLEEDQISPNISNAVIAIEDRRFYEHEGVDYRGIGRALFQDVLARRAAPGRLDDHPAVRQERARGAVRPLGLPEAARGGARLPPRAPVDASRRS